MREPGEERLWTTLSSYPSSSSPISSSQSEVTFLSWKLILCTGATWWRRDHVTYVPPDLGIQEGSEWSLSRRCWENRGDVLSHMFRKLTGTIRTSLWPTSQSQLGSTCLKVQLILLSGTNVKQKSWKQKYRRERMFVFMFKQLSEAKITKNETETSRGNKTRCYRKWNQEVPSCFILLEQVNTPGEHQWHEDKETPHIIKVKKNDFHLCVCEGHKQCAADWTQAHLYFYLCEDNRMPSAALQKQTFNQTCWEQPKPGYKNQNQVWTLKL